MPAEKNFENRVKKFLQSQDCYVIKYWGGGQFTRAGVPDLLVCCNGRFLGVELKAENGRVSDLQIYHQNQINKAGGYGIILYPDQFEWFKDFIRRIKNDNQL